jgi:hypothetical protein
MAAAVVELGGAKQKSARTGRVYKLDVQHFMRTLPYVSYRLCELAIVGASW